MIKTDQIYGTKERWFRRLPNIYGIDSRYNRMEVFQSEFLSQLDPAGHLINDPNYYENIIKVKEIDITRPDGTTTKEKQMVEEQIERVSIPLQQVILEKHLTHLCGENMRFTLNKTDPTESESRTFIDLKQGWEKRNMETAKYEFCKSVKATGDGAFCAYMDKGTAAYKVFSVANGDKLHPIRDFHGKLRVFGRSFSAYNYEKQEEMIYMEVWDDLYYTLLTYSTKGEGSHYQWDTDTFLPSSVPGNDPDGWETVIAPKRHGFSSIPIVYLKDENGACWSGVQHLIDKFEMALSQLFENNKAYAFRIMAIKGGFEIQGDLKGQARAILFNDNEGDAEFLDKADASSSFELQLKETLKYILMGSFTVLPPETPAGDLPGVTIKIMYSPAIEQGLNDKNFFNSSFDKIVSLFKEGYGIEMGAISEYKTLDARGDIRIYIHQNDAEVTNNLVLGTQAGFTSKETATEQSIYSSADEINRLRKQKDQEIEDERRALISESQNTGQNQTNTIRQRIAEA